MPAGRTSCTAPRLPQSCKRGINTQPWKCQGACVVDAARARRIRIYWYWCVAVCDTAGLLHTGSTSTLTATHWRRMVIQNTTVAHCTLGYHTEEACALSSHQGRQHGMLGSTHAHPSAIILGKERDGPLSSYAMCCCATHSCTSQQWQHHLLTSQPTSSNNPLLPSQ